MNIFKVIVFIYFASMKSESFRKISTFWHISDTFWTTKTNSYCATRMSKCVHDSLQGLAEKSVQLNADFVLWSSAGGPNLPIVIEQMKKIIKNIIVFPALVPAKLPASNKYTVYYQNISKYFGNWLNEAAHETFWKAGYYSRILEIPKNLQIIVLNTALFCKFHVASKLDDPVSQWRWLSVELLKARKAKRKVYLLLSATPGISNNFTSGMFAAKHNHRYVRMIRTYQDVIIGQFGGYESADKFQLFYDRNDQACSWLMLCPPINTFARLYIYDIETMEPFDFVQFYRKRGVWHVHYRFSSYYSVPNISVFSLELLLKQMESNQELFSKYMTASEHSLEPNTTAICKNYTCIKMHLCKIIAVDYSNYIECIAPDQITNLLQFKSSCAAHLLISTLILIKCVCSRLLVNKLYF